MPALETLGAVWTQVKDEAEKQNKTAFEISSVMAMSAFASLPQKMRWLSISTRVAAGKTGSVVAGVLLEHYQSTLKEIGERGYIRYAVQQYRPYMYGALSQFSPQRRTLTERLLLKKNRARRKE